MRSNIRNKYKKNKYNLHRNEYIKKRDDISRDSIYKNIQDYLCAEENTYLDVMFKRALENIQQKNNES